MLAVAVLAGAVCNTACGGGPPPRELRSARITVEADAYTRNLLFESEWINLVTDIRAGNFDSDPEWELMVVGTGGAAIITRDGALEREIEYAISGLLPTRLYEFGVGDYGFLGSGFGRGPTCVMLGRNGELMWRYDESGTTAVGEDELGVQQILVLQRDTVTVLEPRSGSPRNQPRAWTTIPLDYVAFSPPHVLVRGAETTYVMYADPNSDHVMSDEFDRIYVDSESGAVDTLETPYARILRVVAAGMFDPQDDSVMGLPGFVSLLQGRGGWHRTVLSVHEPVRGLVYQEILDGDYRSVLPLPDSGGALSFLLGGRNQVWWYRTAR